MAPMSYKAEPMVCLRDTGQQILCFEKCQLTITWMSDIKDARCKPRLEYGRDVARRRRRCCWAQAPAIHAVSHVAHEKRVAWVSISMHECGSVPIVIVLRLASLRVPELRQKG